MAISASDNHLKKVQAKKDLEVIEEEYAKAHPLIGTTPGLNIRILTLPIELWYKIELITGPQPTSKQLREAIKKVEPTVNVERTAQFYEQEHNSPFPW